MMGGAAGAVDDSWSNTCTKVIAARVPCWRRSAEVGAYGLVTASGWAATAPNPAPSIRSIQTGRHWSAQGLMEQFHD